LILIYLYFNIDNYFIFLYKAHRETNLSMNQSTSYMARSLDIYFWLRKTTELLLSKSVNKEGHQK